MKLIDLHTHCEEMAANPFAIRQLELHDKQPEGGYSFGLHPWRTTEEREVGLTLSRLEELLQSNRPPLLIGECGLDRLRGATMERQIELFEAQLCLAARFRRGVIVHCVKAWEELEQLAKCHTELPLLIHGFRGSPQLAQQLLRHPNISLSLGFRYNAATLSVIPVECLFLESDTLCFNLESLYEEVAMKKGLTCADLAEQIDRNFTQLIKI